ncbi:hypothetical protein FLL45_08555 [Aliikangiella marina]|uniref:Peptidase M14 domain-containing protein n=1 Tax=Aliikangiella marina TaxID=1712262 RepID=A0A545TCN2_9GAMM|nr:M14 family metallopeptidase [Aliikangiella marina]TQV74983.1 hypothetical protein FLL45_08555 [Aliikangiella marina]
MYKSLIVVFLFIANIVLANAVKSVELEYYLPNAATYNPAIPAPESVLGYQVGDWHIRPEQIERYFMALADSSPRMRVEVIGYTHERRPLILAYVSSPENLANLETLRQQHLSGEKSAETPVVTWMGYSVHGNEPSGSNSSVLFAYHLAAANDEQTLAFLSDQIIIIDPMLNPDGLARFAHWANMYKAKNLNPDPKNIEHNENWPRGRTNHYWFDLNRDWLLLQHPESQARVAQFQKWRPHILTDFHEMGTNSTYFFQPGVPSRQNPLTPESNFKMTAKIAEFHAKALDEIGSLYYTKESFDDFYYGKGSTYPDIHGSVGILFEQASSRGHLQKSSYGELSFPFTIRNQLTASFSTIEAAQNLQADLKAMQRGFINESAQLARADRNRGVVVGSADQYRLAEMSRILTGHNIDHYPLAKDLAIKGQKFASDNSLIIPLRQKQYRLIKAMFETRTKFKDKVFYDVSTWNMAMSLGLDYAFVSRSDYEDNLKGSFEQKATSELNIDEATIALAFDWNNMQTSQLLSQLLTNKLRVQTVTKSTQMRTSSGLQQLSLGSIILPLENQHKDKNAIAALLKPMLEKARIKPVQIQSGLATNGIDLGSPSLPVVKPIKPLLVIGEGMSSYSAGEIWHLLDQRLSQTLTMMTKSQLAKLKSIDYSHIIIAGSNPNFDETTTAKLKSWLEQGGVMIAHGQGAKWITEQQWTSSEAKTFDKPVDTEVAYDKKSQTDAEHVVGGAIAKAKIDTTHPLGFGLDSEALNVFKRGNLAFTEPREAFVSIARFTDKPLASGYMSQANRDHIANQTSIFVQAVGNGRVIGFSDNPVFRGYFLGTAKVFVNALYFGKIIRSPARTEPKEDEKKDVKKK